MLKVTLLGTGTSGGVPALGCECDVCRSTDPKDKRLRSAAMIETESTRLLIDAGPDQAADAQSAFQKNRWVADYP